MRMHLWACSLGLLLPFAVLAAPGDVFYVDATLGDDANPGSASQPWQTIQHAADRLHAGETVRVRAGIYSQLELSYPVSSVRAIKPAYSGTSSDPIVYESDPLGAAIIDQQGQGAGFFLFYQDYITICGFEIRNAKQGGVWTAIDGQTGIVIEDNWIHHIDGDAGTNVGAVKLDGCSQCSVRNNLLHDVRVDGVYYTNGAGVHSYDMRQSTIENNEIFNAYTGIFHKRGTAEPGMLFTNNTIHHATLGVLFSRWW